MMAEVIVVAAIILVAITGFYSLYTSAISAYNTKINYYDVSTLYALAAYRDNEYKNVGEADGELFCDENCKLIKKSTVENVYSLKLVVKTETVKGIDYEECEDINLTLGEYLNYLSKNLKEDLDILVMEKCDADKTNCKYAYLKAVK